MEVKLIALDLDGTLLLPNKTISDKNKISLMKAAQEKGIYITLATGRPYSAVKKVLEWLPCIRYAVLSNGAVVQDTRTGEKIAEHLVKTKDALAFYDYAVSHDLIVDFFDQGERIVSSKWKTYIEKMDISEGAKQLLLSNCMPVEDQRGYLQSLSGVEKISMRCQNEEVKNQYCGKIETLFSDLKICSSLETNVEATCKGVTKASGLQELLSHLKIGKDSVMAFGDSGNDYEMLEMAGLGVAMGNADPEIKEIADQITKSNTEDGVDYMVREVLGWQQELL